MTLFFFDFMTLSYRKKHKKKLKKRKEPNKKDEIVTHLSPYTFTSVPTT